MRVLIAAVAATLACASEPPDEACTLLGCAEVATLNVIAVTSSAALADTSIEVCHAGACVRGAVPAPSVPHDNSTYLSGALTVRIELRPVSGGFELIATIQQVANDVVDGDGYTVSVRRSDGTALVERAWTAIYSYSFPNGPDCDRCVHADVSPVPQMPSAPR